MLSAIAFVHKILNYPDPAATFAIRKLMHSIQKQHIPDSRLPITPPLLTALIEAFASIDLKNYDICLYKAMFLFMYYTLARISEVAVNTASQHTLNLADISSTLDSSGNVASLVVHFKSFKHSKNTSQASIAIFPQPENRDCPVTNLLRYLQNRGTHPGFLFLSNTGNAVTCDSFSKILKACVVHLHLDPHKYTSHSFRIGAVTTAAALSGASDSTLRRLGRWSSDAFKKYIRT
ncbi:uncharacterized protein LOC144909433 [Branchiostoma floridae x Branchiostoma belcheri]